MALTGHTRCLETLGPTHVQRHLALQCCFQGLDQCLLVSFGFLALDCILFPVRLLLLGRCKLPEGLVGLFVATASKTASIAGPPFLAAVGASPVPEVIALLKSPEMSLSHC